VVVMADTMVVVDQKSWRSEERAHGAPMVPGVLLAWRNYQTKARSVESYLDAGDRLFLFHAHGEQLWLAAVYEDVHLKSSDNGRFLWRARHRNRVPILDITPLRRKLKFHTGNGLTRKAGALGNSLQSPRKFTHADLELLEAAMKGAGTQPLPSRWMSVEEEALEGRKLLREITVYERDPKLALACITRDSYTCRLCKFRVDKKRFPAISEDIRARIVQAHHVRLISKGKRTSKVGDLVTLCPTCHLVAHAVAAATSSDCIDLAMLRRYFRP
jgi:hypothetical protein